MFRTVLLVSVFGAFIGIASLGVAQETEKKNPVEDRIEHLMQEKEKLSERLKVVSTEVNGKPVGQHAKEHVEKRLESIDKQLAELNAKAEKQEQMGATAAQKGAQYAKNGTPYKKDMFELMKQINGKRVNISKDPRIKDKKKAVEDLSTIQAELRSLMKDNTTPEDQKKEKFEALKEKFENLGKPVDPKGEPLPE